MQIDVMVNSCGRVKLLEPSLLSAKKYIYSDKHKLRWVLIEDCIGSDERKQKSNEWITNNFELFDEVFCMLEPAGVGFWWQETIKKVKSAFHIHLEDDNVYTRPLCIDPLVDIMIDNPSIINIIFNRGPLKTELINESISINDIALYDIKLMSIAAGIFNTSLCKKLLDTVGWDNKIHEWGTLSPASAELGFKKFMLHCAPNYDNIGHTEKYRKGKYE